MSRSIRLSFAGARHKKQPMRKSGRWGFALSYLFALEDSLLPILRLQPQWELGSLPSTKTAELSNADKGNYETVEIMRREAHRLKSHPKVRELALKILESNGVGSHNFLEEARALAEFVQREVRYVRDINDVEQLHDPLYMIKLLESGTAQGDCDDMSLLLATLMLAVGHQPYFAIVRYKATTGPYNHIYVTTYDRNWGGPKRRLVMDTILKDRPIGREVPHKSRKEIRV